MSGSASRTDNTTAGKQPPAYITGETKMRYETRGVFVLKDEDDAIIFDDKAELCNELGLLGVEADKLPKGILKLYPDGTLYDEFEKLLWEGDAVEGWTKLRQRILAEKKQIVKMKLNDDLVMGAYILSNNLNNDADAAGLTVAKALENIKELWFDWNHNLYLAIVDSRFMIVNDQGKLFCEALSLGRDFIDRGEAELFFLDEVLMTRKPLFDEPSGPIERRRYYADCLETTPIEDLIENS